MYKNVLIVIFFLLLSIYGFTQSGKEGYRYCRVDTYITKSKFFFIDYGNYQDHKRTVTTFVDSSLEKVTSIPNEVLMLNYMGDLGWECFKIAPQNTGTVFYFRKSKDK